MLIASLNKTFPFLSFRFKICVPKDGKELTDDSDTAINDLLKILTKQIVIANSSTLAGTLALGGAQFTELILAN